MKIYSLFLNYNLKSSSSTEYKYSIEREAEILKKELKTLWAMHKQQIEQINKVLFKENGVDNA